MLKALDRKLLRDLGQMKGQALAICLVMASGVALFVMSLSTLGSLRFALDSYYERNRFAHVFTRVKRAPASLAVRLGEVPGVTWVQTRVVVDVSLDVPGLAEPAVGRLIGIPERPRPGLNELHLRRGRYIEAGRRGEVIVDERFAEAHELGPGDTLKAVINGRRQLLRIVGVGLSPEYVFPIREGEMLPDNRRFGVFWAGATELAAAFDMQGAFNDVTLMLAPGANEKEVQRQLDRLTEPHGGRGAYGRSEQTSHRLIAGELQQLGGMAFITPLIFLAVSAFLLHVVLTRLISLQREQIAALKAFGYNRLEIGLHYLKLVGLLVLLGVGLGTLVGAWLGHGMTHMYTDFFRFPVLGYILEPWIVLAALAISGGAAVLGTLSAVRKAMRLAPAEAMRPEPPASYRPALVERWGLQWLFSAAVRMILRNLERQPVKTALSCLGIALAIAVLILGNCIVDAIDHVVLVQFFFTQRQDVTVLFVEPTSTRALHEVRRLPGVVYAEPFRSVPARLRFGPRSRRMGIQGLTTAPRLQRVLNQNQQEIVLPGEGLVVSAKLAELLGCAVGDEIEVEILEGERPTRRVVLSGVIHDFTDLSAYMDLGAVRRLMREGDTLSGAYLQVDAGKVDELYKVLKGMPRVASVTVKMAALRSFEKTLAENVLRMQAFNIAFATIIAFGVVYNCARISLSERSRELATLRVMGFTRGEISAILLGELAVLTLLAIVPGMALGRGFAHVLTFAMETETQRFPLMVYPGTYAFAVVVVLVAALLSGLVVRRRLDHLDLVAVLKSRE